MKRQMSREKLLFRYSNALERGDFDTIADVLETARRDPILERMILEVHEVYVAELQSGQPFRQLNHREKIMNISAVPRTWKPSFTLAVAAMIAVLFASVFLFNAFSSAPINFSGLFQSQEDTNIAVFQRYTEEAWNQGNTDMLGEVVTADHVRHDNGVDMTGVDAIAALVMAYRTAMPDLRFDVQDITAEADRVWAYLIGAGTQTGPLVFPDGTTIPASDEPLSLRAMAIGRFVDGKIAEIWVEYDNLGWMQQSGVVPSLQQTLTERQNATVARRFFDEGFINQNMDMVDETYHDGARWCAAHSTYCFSFSNTYRRGAMQNIFSAFPDLELTIEQILASGDTVTIELRGHGTFSETFQEPMTGVRLTPTNQSESWSWLVVLTFEEAKVSQERWYWYFDGWPVTLPT
jgi:predicted ester cyclase